MITITCSKNELSNQQVVKNKIRNEILKKGTWFVPIPRIASKSIRLKLGEVFGDLFAHKGRIKGHGFASDYKGIIGKEVWNSVFTFGFVRNPWDRLVSSYRFRDHEITFSEYVRSKNWKHLGIEMSKYLLDDSNNSLVSFIGKYENLDDDLDYVFKKLNVYSKIDHYHESKREHYTKYYNEETKEIVAEHFKRDIEVFGYQYGE